MLGEHDAGACAEKRAESARFSFPFAEIFPDNFVGGRSPRDIIRRFIDVLSPPASFSIIRLANGDTETRPGIDLSSLERGPMRNSTPGLIIPRLNRARFDEFHVINGL